MVVGEFTTLVITLVLFGVPVSQLLVGGALTTVFVSIAAQQALGNVFAGLVLVFARPFMVGDAIRLRAGALGGTLDGTVTDIGITYVRFDTGGSVMSIPNSQVLNAVVGPIPPDEEDDGPAPAVIDGKSGTPGGPEQTSGRESRPGRALRQGAWPVGTAAADAAAKGRPAGEQIARQRAGPSSRQPVRRSPLGERHNAAPAERYSAKAVGAARGHSRTGRSR